jgi:hemophore-related protein
MHKRVRTVAAAAAGVVLAGSLAAVPALGSAGRTTTPQPVSASAPLTDAQKQLVDEFLTDHPLFAAGLAHRAKVWHDFLAAHPDFAAEIAKVLALPVGQRRAELVSWLRDHPAVRHDLRQMRRELRQDRRDRRQERRQDRRTARGTTGSSATSFAV